jgi:hypothetical protein
MKRILSALSASLAFALVSPAAGAGDWFKVESDHFIVRSDGSEKEVQDDVRQLEAFRYLSLMLLGADLNNAPAQTKFEIYMLKKRSELLTVRPNFSENVAGVYLPCAEGATAYSILERRDWHEGADQAREILFHEYTHHLMFQYGRVLYPQWYVEGFAEYMSTARAEDGRILLGDKGMDSADTLNEDRWLGFDEILKPSFNSSGDKNADMRAMLSLYAQGWLLTHYMINDDERTRKINAYFERIGHGEDPVAAFEPATGIALNTLPRLLKNYYRGLSVVRVSFKDMPAVNLKLEAVPAALSEDLLKASVLKTCPAKAQGETILAQLRAHDAKGSLPEQRLALARAEMLFGSTKAALDMLDAHSAEDEASFEDHYLRGRALMKNAGRLQGDAQDEMVLQARAEFVKAYRLKKLDAPNLYYLARSLAIDGAGKSVLNAARGAHALAPTVPAYAFEEAYFDLSVGDRDKAANALAPLASDPHDTQGAARMRGVIDAIKAGKSLDEINGMLKE